MALKIRLDLDATRIKQNLNRVEARFKASSQRMNAYSLNMSKGLLVAGAQLAAIAITLGKLGKAAANIESVTTQFKVLTGSATTAKKKIAELQEFSAKTPFQFNDISKAGAALLAYKVNTEDLIPRLRERKMRKKKNSKTLLLFQKRSTFQIKIFQGK